MKNTINYIGFELLRGMIRLVVLSSVFSFAHSTLSAQSFLSVPGKFERGQCAVYAGNLQNKLTTQGKESHLLIYQSNAFGESIRHAFVVFRGKDGSYMGIDNERRDPMVMTGSTPEEWVRQFSHTKKATLMAAHSESGGAVLLASN
jgi:hypothetical protein